MFSGVTTIMPLYLGDAGADEIAGVIRAGESVLSQECGVAQELLIIDDGSEPPLESSAGLRPLLDRRHVRVCRLVRNQGLVYALNAGLSQARYDLIARIDGDDFWRPGKLKRQIEVLMSDPDLTLAATSMRLVHPHNPSLDGDDLRGGDWEHVLDFFRATGCPFPHGSILARKDVFHLLGGYPHAPTFTHCEDFALWGSWARFFKVRVLDDVLFEYTVSSGQISGRFAGQQKLASGMVHQTFLNLGDSRRIPWAVETIAASLELPLLDTARVLCRAWRFYENILVDRDLIEAAAVVFPDRAVHLFDEIRDLLEDHYFYLRGGPYDGDLSRHARVIHTPL